MIELYRGKNKDKSRVVCSKCSHSIEVSSLDITQVNKLISKIGWVNVPSKGEHYQLCSTCVRHMTRKGNYGR